MATLISFFTSHVDGYTLLVIGVLVYMVAKRWPHEGRW